MKRVIIFRWLLPVIYLATLLIYLLVMISGAGHIPRGLDFLFFVIAGPCYLLDFIMPKALVQNPLLVILICGIFSFLTYAVVGWLIDIALKKVPRPPRVKTLPTMKYRFIMPGIETLLSCLALASI